VVATTLLAVDVVVRFGEESEPATAFAPSGLLGLWVWAEPFSRDLDQTFPRAEAGTPATRLDPSGGRSG
jgi:hypothetical protein